jgi:hypothetical protein
VKGCLLVYRRREQDMPLQQPPDNATPEQIAKTEQVRQKVLRLAREKFLFRFQDRRLTQGLVVENGRLVGIQAHHSNLRRSKVQLRICRSPSADSRRLTGLGVSPVGIAD